MPARLPIDGHRRLTISLRTHNRIRYRLQQMPWVDTQYKRVDMRRRGVNRVTAVVATGSASSRCGRASANRGSTMSPLKTLDKVDEQNLPSSDQCRI